MAAHDDSQLLLDIAAICTSGSHEANDMAKLRQGVQKFGIQQLEVLAKMLEERTLDVQNHVSLAATKALLEYAEQLYGKESREAVVCRRQVVAFQSVVDWQKGADLAVENTRCASVLSSKNSKDQQCKLLYLTVQLEQMIIEKQHVEDNPLQWERLYQIEKELEPFFKEQMVYSPELVDACQYMADLQGYQPTYVFYLSEQQFKIFPNGHYLEGRIDGNGLFSNMEAYIQYALNGAKTLWGDWDLRTLNVETDLLTIQMRNRLTEFETVHNRLREVQDYMRDYLPQGDLNIDRLEILLWECDIRYGENLSEIRSAYPIQLRVKANYGEESETYLNMVCQLATLMMMVDEDKGKALLEEAERLAGRLCQPGTDFYDVYLLYLITSKQTMSTDDPQVFRDYLMKCIDYYQQWHRASWESVYVGRSIANVLNSSVLLPEKAAELQQTALIDLEQLTGRESVIYASCQMELVSLLSMSQNKTDWQRAVEYCQEAMDVYELHHVSLGELYRTLHDLQLSLGLKEEAMQTLRTFIKNCVRPEDGMWRCLMQLILGWDLYNNQNSSHDVEIKQLFEDAIPFFEAHIEETSSTYMEGYVLINNYYQTLAQLDKAEEILKRGMAHHEALYGEYDFIYEQMLSALYYLYADGMNDMDKAEQLMENRVENIRRQPSFSLNYIVLQLLWNRYRLLSRKSNDWMLRFTALKEIQAQVKWMAELAGKDEAIKLKGIAIPLLYEWTGLFPLFGHYMKQARELGNDPESGITEEQKEAVDRISTMLIDVARNQLLPEFMEMEQQMKEESSDYLDSDGILNLYIALANYYLGIEQDTLKAESYYRDLLQSGNVVNKYRAVSELAYLKGGQRQYDEAARLFEQQEQMAAHLPLAMQSLQDKSYFYSAQAYAYQMCGRYRDAIEPSRKNFSLRQELANQNFDLLTQAERENFIQDGGVGGDGIIFLLPKFPQELSKDGYDVLLASRSLLLRASERIKKAIIESGDQEVVAQLDSLNRLTARYKTMNTQTDWVHGNYEYDPETVKLRQEIERLERSINRQAAQFIESMDTPDWKKLQDVLKPGEAAVEYVLSDSVSCGALVLLPKGEPQYVPLAPSNGLWHALDNIKTLDAQQKAEALYQEDRLKLYDSLWKPLEKYLNGTKKVFYSPTGFLNELAFSAFMCIDGSYLSDHYELHQMLSTGDLIDLRKAKQKDAVRTAYLYGSVFYSPEQELETESIKDNKPKKNRGAFVDAFDYLPFTKQEVSVVGNLMSDKQIEAHVLEGFSATEESVHSINEHSPDVLHLSTHGFFIKGDKYLIDNKFLSRFPAMRFSSMQRSGLAFVGANNAWEGATDKAEDADGILTANEVALLDLSKTRLAVLSACQTAVGEYTLEGVYGMHRGFKQAGVRSILATLWNVNDKSTARLMELFYDKWLSGTPMQQSLNEAVRELRKEHPSPFYWAPFVLMDPEN